MSQIPPIPEDPRQNFCVMILIHTPDAQKCLDTPHTVRRIVGDALDSLRDNYDHAPAMIEEEVDYTLDVYRTGCDKDVTTNRIRGLEERIAKLTAANAELEAENARLKAPMSGQEAMQILKVFWPLDQEGVRSSVRISNAVEQLLASRARIKEGQ